MKIKLNNPKFTLEDYDIVFLKNVNENNESKGKKFVSPAKDRKIHGQNQFLSPSNNNMNPLF